MPKDRTPGTITHETLDAILRAHPKTSEPVNALIVWTEIGRALAGTLDRQGASLGLLRQIISSWGRGRTDVGSLDLQRFIYRVPEDRRLGKDDLATLMREISTALATAAPAAFETQNEPDLKAIFIEVVKGWYPLGIEIVRRLPAAAGATDLDLVAVLTAWCDKYLPIDPDGPSGLGIKVDRKAAASDVGI